MVCRLKCQFPVNGNGFVFKECIGYLDIIQDIIHFISPAVFWIDSQDLLLTLPEVNLNTLVRNIYNETKWIKQTFNFQFYVSKKRISDMFYNILNTDELMNFY